MGARTEVRAIEVVEDRTSMSKAGEGFLRVRRLTLRNLLSDGSVSREYACDIVSRTHVDAVAIALYEVDGQGPARRVNVVLKEGIRPPVYLRREKNLVQPDDRPRLSVIELAAGMLEEEDRVAGGIDSRAAAEAWEECGVRVLPQVVEALGSPMFPSPGITDEKVFFRAAPVAVDEATVPEGDGSTMEQGTRLVVMDLADAVAACRDGRMPDMKTEVGLLRLADALGYLPQLEMFAADLPADLRARYRPPGMGQAP